MLTISLLKSIGNYRNLLPTNPPAPVGTSLEQDVERWLDMVPQIAESYSCERLSLYLPCHSAVSCHTYCLGGLLHTLSDYFKGKQLSNAVLEQSEL